MAAVHDRPPSVPAVVSNYFLNEILGSGYSGSIYKATHIHTGQVVALKLQWTKHEYPTNAKERRLFPLFKGGVGMPQLHAFGVVGEWDFIAMDLLGPSLDSIFRRSGQNTFDLRSVCAIAVQVIQRLEFMHMRGILHRDIQLGNIVTGLPPLEKTLYMIDFGFATKFIDQTGRHVPDSKVKRDFIGNYWFSSVNVHCRGKAPSRRDDLEAVALMLIHLLTPRGLSWTRNGVPKNDTQHRRLKSEKKNAKPEDLCRGLPEEFEEFLRYTRGLSFTEGPNYKKWVERFRELAEDEGYTKIDDFIWPPPPIPKNVIARNINTPQRRPAGERHQQDMYNILKDLQKLNLQANNPFANQVRTIKPPEGNAAPIGEREVFELNSDSESDDVPPLRQPAAQQSKAVRLEKLSEQASKAADNKALSELVREFIAVLQMNSSRTLTREALHFLDVLYKQLDDPSVFLVPERRASRQHSFAEKNVEKEPAHVKLGVVARLRRDVWTCVNNKALGVLVADFARITNRSTGRTVTKDGFAFLEGLSQRLKSLSP